MQYYKANVDDRLEAANSEATQLRSQVANLQQMISKQDSEISSLKNVLSTGFSDEMKKYSHLIKKSETEADELRKENCIQRDLISTLKAQVFSIKTEQEIADSKCALQKMQAANALAENDALKKALEEEQNEAEKLRSEFSLFRSTKAKEVHQLSLEYEHAKSNYAALKESFDKTNERNAELQSKLQSAQERALQDQEAAAELEEKFRVEIESKDKLIAALKTSLQESLEKMGMVQYPPSASLDASEEDLMAILEQERLESSRLRRCLDELCAEVEEKFCLLEVEKEQYRKLQEEYRLMSSNLKEKEAEIVEQKRIQGNLEQENKQMKMETADLARQVQILLAEIEGVQSVAVRNLPTDMDVDADAVISDRLVSFRSVQELQTRNQELLRTIRYLTDEKNEEASLTKELEAAMQTIEELKKSRDLEQQMVKDLILQRDTLKGLLDTKEESRSSAKQQSVLFLSKQSAAASPSERELSLENNKLTLQLQFIEERLRESKDSTEFFKKESELLRTKYNEISSNFIELQGTLTSNFTQLVECKQMLQQQQSKNFLMEKESQFLKEQKQALQADCDRLKDEVGRLQVLLSHASYYQSELKEQNVGIIEELKGNLQQAKVTIGHLEAELATSKAEVASSRSELDQKRMEIDQLMQQNTLQAAASSSQRLASQSESSDSWSAIAAALKEELANLSESLAAKSEELHKMQLILAENNDQLQHALESKQQLQVELEFHQAQQELHKGNLTKIQSEENDLRQQISSLQDRLDQEAILRAKEIERSKELQQASEKNEAEKLALQAAVSQLQLQLDEKAGELVVETARSAELKARCADLEAQLDRFITENVALDRVSATEASVFAFIKAQKDTLLLENTSLKTQVKRLTFQLDRNASLIKELEVKIENLEDSSKGLGDQRLLLEKVQEFNILRESNTLLRLESEEKLKRINALENALQAAKDASSTMDTEKAAIAAERNALQQELHLLLQQLKSLNEEREELKQRINQEISGEITSLEESKGILEASLKAAEEKNAQLEEAGRLQTDKLKLFEEKLKSVIEKHRASESKNKKMEAENQQLNEQLSLMKQQAEEAEAGSSPETTELQAKLAEAQEKIQKLAKACQLIKSRLETQTSEFVSLKSANEELSAKLELLKKSQETEPVDEIHAKIKAENGELKAKIEKYVAAIQKFQQLKQSFGAMKAEKDKTLEEFQQALRKIKELEKEKELMVLQLAQQKAEYDLHLAALNSKQPKVLHQTDAEEGQIAVTPSKREQRMPAEESKKMKQEAAAEKEAGSAPVRGRGAAKGVRGSFNRKLNRGQ